MFLLIFDFSDIYLNHNSVIKIDGFYFSEKLENSNAITKRLQRPLYYKCTPPEQTNLGQKYDIWFILIF